MIQTNAFQLDWVQIDPIAGAGAPELGPDVTVGEGVVGEGATVVPAGAPGRRGRQRKLRPDPHEVSDDHEELYQYPEPKPPKRAKPATTPPPVRWEPPAPVPTWPEPEELPPLSDLFKVPLLPPGIGKRIRQRIEDERAEDARRAEQEQARKDQEEREEREEKERQERERRRRKALMMAIASAVLLMDDRG